MLVVGLAVSIALHEFGHLIPAKKFGVRVGQYMIGFGPTLWSRRIGETEYGVKALPLGGYISMAGMYPPSPKELAAAASGSSAGRAGGGFFATMVQDARAANDETLSGSENDGVFYKLSVWKRVVIMLGGPVMNLLFAIVLFTILLSGIGVQTATTTVASVSECVIPADAERTECEAGRPGRARGSRGHHAGRCHRLGRRRRRGDVRRGIRDHPRVTGPASGVVVERDGETQTVRLTPTARCARRSTTRASPSSMRTVTPSPSRWASRASARRSNTSSQPIWAGPQAAFENVDAVAGIIWQLRQGVRGRRVPRHG